VHKQSLLSVGLPATEACQEKLIAVGLQITLDRPPVLRKGQEHEPGDFDVKPRKARFSW